MGVSIHYRGKVKSKKDCAAVFLLLERLADEHGWVLQKPEGVSNAARLLIHKKCDPVHFEFNGKFSIDDFVKTQFAPPAVHIQVVDLLRAVEPHFAWLAVEDEGGFWETGDLLTLKKHRLDFDKSLKKFKAENPGAQGPIQIPTGRWVDVVE